MSARLDASAARVDSAKRFLEKHCIACHGEDEQKGGLRLDTIPFEPAKLENTQMWEQVFQRVADLEMPPKKKARPSEAEQHDFLKTLNDRLVAADLKRQTGEGRVVLRRLNRNEYQNTLFELLGVETDLKSLLPEDAQSLGFDNVGEALNVSAILMERYVEAADAALDAVLVKGKRPECQKWHLSMMPNNIRKPETNSGKWDYRLASGVRVLPDETFIFFNSMFQPMRLEKFQAPVAGHYKFRVSAYAAQSAGHKLSFALYAGSFDPKSLNTHLVGHFDVPPEEPTVIEFTDPLPLRGSIRPLPYRLGQHSINTPELVEAYQGPGIAIQWVEIEGPLIEEWPPRGYQRLLGDLELEKGQLEDAEKALRRILPAAFRRPVEDDEAQPFIDLVSAELKAGKKFEDAFRGGIKAVLCSPDFLFLKEVSPSENPLKQKKRASSTRLPLADFALASRLSYFLWSSPPDDTLFEIAKRGTLRDGATLHSQVERMLSDAKAQRFVSNFTGQWLGLRNIELTTPDKKLYPEYDDALQEAMLKETQLFFAEVLHNDLPVTHFIDSDFTMLNERIAKHYGISGVDGQNFRKVSLDPAFHRGGLLGQAAILKVTANGTNTSPIIRGNWVLKNILGKPVNPPPPNIPAIEPDIRGAKSIREQIAKHRELASCAGCHDRMDPLGLALENYDVIGGWREAYRSTGEGKNATTEVEGRRVQYKIGLPVDASGVLQDGRSFQTLAELKSLLFSEGSQVAQCLGEKLLVYSTGGPPGFADKMELREIIHRAGGSGLGLRRLIHEIVQSQAFLNK
ncbi:MAG: Protein of unknown function DUF1592/DUF1588/DUF1587/DUF1595/DUF1585 /Planctomycete cytochrome C [Verrucomicrobia bacterium]|nr:MAG: Protein of unknown function DUF1592/DUF1588/DUF1587/DUF1595/DUF1585 /Planctomycete cytochrome C [Verrucomicrobiota bacterium]